MLYLELVSCGYLLVQTKFHVIQSINVVQIVVALLGALYHVHYFDSKLSFMLFKA